MRLATRPRCSSLLHQGYVSILKKVLPPARYLPTYLPTYLPIYLRTYLPTHLPTYCPSHLLTYLSACLPTDSFSAFLNQCCKGISLIRNSRPPRNTIGPQA